MELINTFNVSINLITILFILAFNVNNIGHGLAVTGAATGTGPDAKKPYHLLLWFKLLLLEDCSLHSWKFY